MGAYPKALALILFFLGLNLVPHTQAFLLPELPVSDFLEAVPGEPSIDFCAQWNPEFAYRGYRCCSEAKSYGKGPSSLSRLNPSRLNNKDQILLTQSSPAAKKQVRKKRRGRSSQGVCAPNRRHWSFCSEMTDEQRQYIENIKKGIIPNTLEETLKSAGRKGNQSFCKSANGFIANGRPLVETESNRIRLRAPERCANFGTDQLVGAMDWLGNQISKEYRGDEFKEVKLVVGDLSAPRGGCLTGRYGTRAHKSHTNGLDVDFAFFNPVAGKPSEEKFTRTFNPISNWWLIKQLFRNPFGCVKIVFLDSKLIGMMSKKVGKDPEWAKLRPYLKHVRGHKDHFHARIGEAPGEPGCKAGTITDDEVEDLSDEGEDYSDQIDLSTIPQQSKQIND